MYVEWYDHTHNNSFEERKRWCSMSTRSKVSPFCIARAQASQHHEGATKGEAKVFQSRDLQRIIKHDDRGYVRVVRFYQHKTFSLAVKRS